jgi:hypothetical protein
MRAKLRYPRPNSLLRTSSPPRGLLGRPLPHMLYANIAFGTPGARKDAKRLLEWLEFPPWSDERILRFLEKHQGQFRRCLEWLSRGSDTNLNEEPDEDDFWDIRMREKWEREPEVKFLQQHGLDHGRALLQPSGQDGSSFWGIELHQRKPRDPLDLICWYILSMLMWDGTVGLRRCQYPKCSKFFQPRTARRRFCSDACRAKDFMGKKSLAEKRKYMRKYRANPRRRRILSMRRAAKT